MSKWIFLTSILALLGLAAVSCGGSSDSQAGSIETESAAPSNEADLSVMTTTESEAPAEASEVYAMTASEATESAASAEAPDAYAVNTSESSESAAPAEVADVYAMNTSGYEAGTSPQGDGTTEVALQVGEVREACNPTKTGVAYSRMFIPEINDEAYSFTLPSARGPEYSLSSFEGDKNVVLVFYRAFWCTNCREQLEDLSAHYDEIRDLDAEVLVVSTDDLADAGWVVDQLGVPYPVLYNTELNVPMDWGVFSLLGDDLATSSTFVIDKEGVIRWLHVGFDIEDQAPTADLLAQLKMLQG